MVQQYLKKLYTDNYFVSRHTLTFIFVKYRSIKYLTLDKYLFTRSTEACKHIDFITHELNKKRYSVMKYYVDNIYSWLKRYLREANIIIVSKGEYVPQTERSVFTVKDNGPYFSYDLQYKIYPITTTKFLVDRITDWFNRFTKPDRINEDCIPNTIIYSKPKIDHNNLIISFRSY